MTISAKVIADSISPEGHRLTTIEATYPRFIHAELLTHRAFSRNAASSRAIPVDRMIAAVEENPVIPVYWGKNQKGMQAREELDEATKTDARMRWASSLQAAIWDARALAQLGVHKQLVNRLLEPFAHITTIISATEWEHFYTLRCHSDAQPEMQALANAIRDVHHASEPELVSVAQWHLPYIRKSEERNWDVSVARCARVSYLNHEGKNDVKVDLELADRLLKAGHMSPFEHQATPCSGTHANFRGWKQYRTLLEEGL